MTAHGPGLEQLAAAKAVCARLPDPVACLRWALDTGQEAGVWGGTGEDDRRALRRARTMDGSGIPPPDRTTSNDDTARPGGGAGRSCVRGARVSPDPVTLRAVNCRTCPLVEITAPATLNAVFTAIDAALPAMRTGLYAGAFWRTWAAAWSTAASTCWAAAALTLADSLRPTSRPRWRARVVDLLGDPGRYGRSRGRPRRRRRPPASSARAAASWPARLAVPGGVLGDALAGPRRLVATCSPLVDAIAAASLPAASAPCRPTRRLRLVGDARGAGLDRRPRPSCPLVSARSAIFSPVAFASPTTFSALLEALSAADWALARPALGVRLGRRLHRLAGRLVRAGGDGVGLADLAVGAVDDDLAAAVVADDLGGPLDRLGLRRRLRAGALGALLLHLPAVLGGDDVPVGHGWISLLSPVVLGQLLASDSLARFPARYLHKQRGATPTVEWAARRARTPPRGPHPFSAAAARSCSSRKRRPASSRHLADAVEQPGHGGALGRDHGPVAAHELGPDHRRGRGGDRPSPRLGPRQRAERRAAEELADPGRLDHRDQRAAPRPRWRRRPSGCGAAGHARSGRAGCRPAPASATVPARAGLPSGVACACAHARRRAARGGHGAQRDLAG